MPLDECCYKPEGACPSGPAASCKLQWGEPFTPDAVGYELFESSGMFTPGWPPSLRALREDLAFPPASIWPGGYPAWQGTDLASDIGGDNMQRSVFTRLSLFSNNATGGGVTPCLWGAKDEGGVLCWFGENGPSHWSRWSSNHWEYPLLAVTLYVAMIVLLRRHMDGRPKYEKLLGLNVNSLVAAWNLFLSVFSAWGLFLCLPRQAAMVWHYGLRPSVCWHPHWNANQWHGLALMLFIYSKFFELIDTVWLLIKKRPVIFLQPYHHVTVLLYCWHAYTSRIGIDFMPCCCEFHCSPFSNLV